MTETSLIEWAVTEEPEGLFPWQYRTQEIHTKSADKGLPVCRSPEPAARLACTFLIPPEDFLQRNLKVEVEN